MIELCCSTSCCIDPILTQTAATSEYETAGGENIQTPDLIGEEMQQMCVFLVLKRSVLMASQQNTFYLHFLCIFI